MTALFPLPTNFQNLSPRIPHQRRTQLLREGVGKARMIPVVSLCPVRKSFWPNSSYTIVAISALRIFSRSRFSWKRSSLTSISAVGSATSSSSSSEMTMATA